MPVHIESNHNVDENHNAHMMSADSVPAQDLAMNGHAEEVKQTAPKSPER